MALMTANLSSTLPAFLTPLTGLIDQGGPVVLLLLVLSVVAVALIAAKLLQFAAMGAGRHSSARRAIDLWLAGRSREALNEVRGTRTVLSEIVEKLLTASLSGSGNRQDLQEDIERICIERITTLRAYLRPLDMIAQTAPLIGLLGTVLGMIEAFKAMQGAGAAVDPSVLAGGIWVALMTTAVGLAVAIPVSAILGWFDSRIEREQAAMEALVTAFFTGAAAERAQPTREIFSSAEAVHAI